jgi:hypothetical protein
MKNSKRYMRAGGVVVIAFGTGHVMQHGGAIAARFGVSDSPQMAAYAADTSPATQIAVLSTPRTGDAKGLSFIPGARDIRPAVLPAQRLHQPVSGTYAALDTANDATPEVPAASQPRDAADCGLALSAETRPGAMVALRLSAPCHPNTEVHVRHAAIGFAAMTDAEGQMEVEVPALEISALFAAEIAGLAPAEGRAEVPDLTGYDRVVVSWHGNSGLELHALEFGALYGQSGHVWRGNARDVSWALRASGGFATLLGHPDQAVPQLAEIYTFPAAETQSEGVVRLSLEAEITASNCGQDVVGRTQQVDAGTARPPVEIALAMPGCDAAGDFLVLNNLFQDLKIAAR